MGHSSVTVWASGDCSVGIGVGEEGPSRAGVAVASEATSVEHANASSVKIVVLRVVTRPMCCP